VGAQGHSQLIVLLSGDVVRSKASDRIQNGDMERRKSGKAMKGGTLEDKMDSQEIDEDRQNGRYLQLGRTSNMPSMP
jgi:hypothetical protein